MTPPIASRTLQCSAQAHLHRMLHRVLRAVHTEASAGRFVPSNPEPAGAAVSGNDLRQTKREDAVSSLQSLLKEGANHRDCGVPKVPNA